MAKTAVKKAGKKSVEKSVLVPARNGGMIRRGSLPGNTPGTGRPPNELRDAMRGDLEKLLPQLWQKYSAGSIDALEFANFLARYGLGTKDEVSLTDHPEWKRRMDALRTALLEIVGEDKATAVILRANELAGAR